MPNTNVPVLDLPFFELCNQAPVVTSAVSGMTTAEDGTSRFIYYLSTSNFYRYDTVADTWQQLANPNVAPTGVLSMRYTPRRGFHARVLAATSTTVTLPSMVGPALHGETLSIEFGTGREQERVLSYVGETVHDAGVITAVSVNVLVDSTKKWRVNQWAGYMVGIRYGTNATAYKKILYNDATTLTIADANLMPHDPWNNQPFVAASPYAVPVTTAGSQAHYTILSATFEVNTPWTVIPDTTSYVTTLSGGIYLVSSTTAAPFFTFQYYCVLSDMWQSKTVPQSLNSAAIASDVSIERTGKIGTVALTGTATSATARTLVDSSKALERDRYANYRLYITGGTGAGQTRRIVAHTGNTFTIPRNWSVQPDATSTYEVWPDSDRVYMAGNGGSTLLAYSPENDYWMQGQAFDDGVTTNVAATMEGWMPVGVSTGARIAAGVQSINTTPTAGGANYSLGDLLTCSVGGTGAQVRVTGIAPGGAVTGLELVHTGTATGFTVGSGRATTGGTGTGCTIEITAVGPTALITTATAHWFRTGDSITFSGCSEAAWNAAHTVVGVPATTTFCVIPTATANMAAAVSQSTTVISDPTKSWIPNEHVGRLVHLMVAGTAPTSQIRWITANTETTLTVAAITAAVNGTSKYVIYDSKIFGIDDQRKETGMSAYGWATGGSTTTLEDSSKNWVPNQWAGYFFRVEAGTGYGSGRILITSNTATTLTYATQGFTPNATTRYEIADSWGVCTGAGTGTANDTTKAWVVNQWAGKRVRYTAGSTQGMEYTCSSNTANQLSGVGNSDATTAYAILGIPPRGAGIELIWAWGATDPKKAGRCMFLPRGGGTNQLDIYDLTTGKWEYGIHFRPQNELFTTGSNYAYDGANKIYLSRSVAGQPVRIFEFDINERRLLGKATTTHLQGTVHIGNLLEVVEANGYKFIYTLQNTGTLFARALLF